jgi:hypothetical protein
VLLLLVLLLPLLLTCIFLRAPLACALALRSWVWEGLYTQSSRCYWMIWVLDSGVRSSTAQGELAPRQPHGGVLRSPFSMTIASRTEAGSGTSRCVLLLLRVALRVGSWELGVGSWYCWRSAFSTWCWCVLGVGPAVMAIVQRRIHCGLQTAVSLHTHYVLYIIHTTGLAGASGMRHVLYTPQGM